MVLEKITDLRKKNGISQRQLAQALNVTQASISRWEANQNSISGENLKKLAEYFKISANSILGLD